MPDALDRLRAYCERHRIALIERAARPGELAPFGVLVESLTRGPVRRRCVVVVCPERLAVAEWSPGVPGTAIEAE